MKNAERLIEHFKGKAETCAELDINPETLRLWLRDGIPPSKALFVEQETGGAITAEDVIAEARERAKAAA